MAILNRIAEFGADMTAWRRHLHAEPELMFDTIDTAGFVVEQLKAFGVDRIETGVAENGVVAVIEGQGPGPTVGLRADMDALPIQETGGVPYASHRPGVMHACGHDGHTAMLLGAARYLAETRAFQGRATLVFQPAEEGGGGGRVMVEAGVMQRYGIDQIYALHNWPGVAPGQINIVEGAAMASGDQFDIEIRGRGGHAATPHLTVDPVMVAMQIGVALQTIVSRSLDPLARAVLTITRCTAGNTYNVIPETAHLAGTVRTLDPEERTALAERLQTMAETLAAGCGAEARVAYHYGYPPTVNDAAATAFAGTVAEEICGAAGLQRNARPSLAAEDFSYMLEAVPGAYVFIGNGASAGLHTSDYDFNDEIAPTGASFLARLVERAGPLDR